MNREERETEGHLKATSQTQHQVQRGLLLDVVVGQGAAVLQLLASEDEALLIRGDALLVLNLLLHVLHIMQRNDMGHMRARL